MNKKQKVITRLREEERLAILQAEAIVGEMQRINVKDGDVLFLRMQGDRERTMELLKEAFIDRGKRVVVIMSSESIKPEDAIRKIGLVHMRRCGWIRAKTSRTKTRS